MLQLEGSIATTTITMHRNVNCFELELARARLDDRAAVSGNRPRFKPNTPVGSFTRPSRGLAVSVKSAEPSRGPLLLVCIPLLISSLVIPNTTCDQSPIASEARGQYNLNELHTRDAVDNKNSHNVKSIASDHHHNHADHHSSQPAPNQHHSHLHQHHPRHNQHRNRPHTSAAMAPIANHHRDHHKLTTSHENDKKPPIHHHHHHHNRRPLSSKPTGLTPVPPSADTRRSLGRAKRHQPGSGANSGDHDPDTMRVAALASKLEHWLQCQRFAMAGNRPIVESSAQWSSSNNHQHANNNQEASDDSLGAATCKAHFDGHLCWPPAKPGQRIQLACPKLNWLPKQTSKDKKGADIDQDHQQHQQPKQLQIQAAKSVMNAIQQPQPTVKPAAVSSPILVKVTTQDGHDQALSSGPIDDSRTADDPHEEADELEIRFAWRRCEPKPLAPGGARSAEPGLALGPATSAGLARNASLTSAGWQDEPDYSQCQWSSSHQLQDPTDEWIKLDEASDRQLFADLAEGLERIEANIDPYAEPDIQEQWSLCIGEIMRQQQRRLNGSSAADEIANSGNSSDQHCPIIFDGWRCWPKTKAGEVAYVSCPSNQPGFIAERKAHKICTPEADWYRHPMTNRYWSNYTTCVDTVDLAFRTKILNLYVIGNLISLIALTASLIIFISFKSLNCTRVTIHKNLFLSFITNNFMWIIWYTCVVNDAGLLQSNPIECRIWHILLHYFLVSNYFWMFCEGLYLHTLLVVAFVSEDKILKWFYLLGWLTPLPITIGYAYNRSYDEYYTNFCWMEESPHNIILMAPIGFSLLKLNLVFLINIVRVLVTKLRANNSPDTHQTRKAVRATLILIPLLGLHYMLTPFRPEAKSEWEVIYEIVAAVCTSFQGLCVAMLFCFFNGEVISVVKKKLKDTFRAREPYRGRSGTKNGSLAFLANNDHHPASKCHRLETSHTLRSVVSSSSNGELARGGPIQANAVAGFGATAYSLSDQTTALMIDAETTSFNIIANGSTGSVGMETIQSSYDAPDGSTSNNNEANGNNHALGHHHSDSATSSLLTHVTASPVSNHRRDHLMNYSSRQQQQKQQQQQQQQQHLIGCSNETTQLVENTAVLGCGATDCRSDTDRATEESVKLL